jgi:Lipocalin-like domain
MAPPGGEGEEVTQPVDTTSRFAGTWRLLSCETRDSNGVVKFPFGNRPAGQLMYDASGDMSAQLMKENRARLATRDPVRATDAELRDAFDGYIAYFGSYSVDEVKQAITHHVRGASFPNWVGVDLVRSYAFDESGRLILSTPPIEMGGESVEYVLVWERANSG